MGKQDRRDRGLRHAEGRLVERGVVALELERQQKVHRRQDVELSPDGSLVAEGQRETVREVVLQVGLAHLGPAGAHIEFPGFRQVAGILPLRGLGALLLQGDGAARVPTLDVKPPGSLARGEGIVDSQATRHEAAADRVAEEGIAPDAAEQVVVDKAFASCAAFPDRHHPVRSLRAGGPGKREQHDGKRRRRISVGAVMMIAKHDASHFAFRFVGRSWSASFHHDSTCVVP